jgi:2'-5' RNA ligase
MRVFVAIQLPPSVIDQLTQLQDVFKRNRRRGNLTTPQNLHLTLVFNGELDYDVLDRLDGVLENLAIPELTLTLDHIGSFDRKDGVVWWAGLQPNPALLTFQRKLTEALREAGIPYDAKPFRPHITLVRNYAPAVEPVMLPVVQPLTFTVNAVTLMRSHRVNEQLVYTPLAVYLSMEEPK